MNDKILRQLKVLFYLLLPLIGGGWMGVSCSESDDEEGEFDNWQQRNETYFASLADSMRQAPAQWVRFKNYSLDQQTEGRATDYIYAKVLQRGNGTDSPMYTDSVRVSYQGRLIPSATYPQGFVFDGTVYGRYDAATNATACQKLSLMIDGYVTALLHMHRGDYWRVYIPSDLAYGATGSSSIPGYSVVIFDLTLIDYSSAGQTMPAWSARRYQTFEGD